MLQSLKQLFDDVVSPKSRVNEKKYILVEFTAGTDSTCWAGCR